jgi:hypothetical protein
MDKAQRHRLSCISLFGLCGLMLLNQSWAAPPPLRATLQRNVSVTVNQSGGQASHPLDLRMPSVMSTMNKPPEGFPVLGHRTLGEESSQRALLPALGGAMGQHIPSKAEVLAKNFKREGLPLAKLWQNQDSLVHLGLNNRGKPGLWLIQKLH